MTLGRLYRCYDRDGALLYIGQTTRPIGVREDEHARAAWWWPAVAFTTYQDISGDLDTAETCAIRAERPWCNRVEYPRELVVGQDRPPIGGTLHPPTPADNKRAIPAPPAPQVRRHRPPQVGEGGPPDDRQPGEA
jgi:hypothetical protein